LSRQTSSSRSAHALALVEAQPEKTYWRNQNKKPGR
jgi:hypothetical protein